MNTRVVSLILPLVGLLSNSVSAQVLNQVLSIENNTLTVDVDNGRTEVFSEAEISASVTPNFVASYSALGDTLLSVTWSAPAGHRFLIAPPENDWNLDGVSLGAAYGFNFELGSIQPVGTVASHDITASNGVPPTFFPFNNLTGPGGDAFFAGVGLEGLQPGETYTLTSLTFESTIPRQLRRRLR